MAKTVFILGAGSSRVAGCPLMPEFIDAADDLRSTQSGISKRQFDLILDLIQNRLPRLHAKTVVDLSNVESVFSLIEMARLLRRLPDTNEEEIDELAAAMRMVLAETVQYSCQFEYISGEGLRPPRPHVALAEFCEEERRTAPDAVALITFNWDLAMDFALHHQSLAIDYGLGQSMPQGSIPLLKLHGSLNWATCLQCNAICVASIQTVFDSVRTTHVVSQTTKRPIDPRPALRGLPQHCHEKRLTELPAVVPPTWNKTQYHEQFASVWRRAAKELADAQDVTVIGYSLPPSDAFFRDLLALGLAGGTRVRKFTVVDPVADVAGRFQLLLGPDSRHRFTHEAARFEDYARERFANRR